MAALDRVDGVQVRQGTRDLEQAVGGAQGQAEAFTGAFQPVLIVVAEAAVLTQLLEVEKGIGAALALLLPLAGGGHRGGGLGTAGAAVGIGVQSGGLAGDVQVQIDAVEQGPGQFAAIALNLFGTAATAAAGIAEVTVPVPATSYSMD